MADIAPQADGSAQITVSAAETAGLKALAATHLPFIERAARTFGADLAPELGEAATFLKSLTTNDPAGSTLTVTAPQVQHLRGLLTSHIPDFQSVLAVVESPAVRSMLTFATALL